MVRYGVLKARAVKGLGFTETQLRLHLLREVKLLTDKDISLNTFISQNAKTFLNNA